MLLLRFFFSLVVSYPVDLHVRSAGFFLSCMAGFMDGILLASRLHITTQHNTTRYSIKTRHYRIMLDTIEMNTMTYTTLNYHSSLFNSVSSSRVPTSPALHSTRVCNYSCIFFVMKHTLLTAQYRSFNAECTNILILCTRLMFVCSKLHMWECWASAAPRHDPSRKVPPRLASSLPHHAHPICGIRSKLFLTNLDNQSSRGSEPIDNLSH